MRKTTRKRLLEYGMHFSILLTSLADNVEAGVKIINAPTRHADVRWFVIPRFRNYLIFYRPHEDTILILRVLHAARDWTRFFGDTGAKPEG